MLDWAQQVGAWWNLGHPWRQNVPWEDEVCQATQGPVERHGLPDWDRWRLATSDRGLIFSRHTGTNQAGELVFSFVGSVFVQRRPE